MFRIRKIKNLDVSLNLLKKKKRKYFHTLLFFQGLSGNTGIYFFWQNCSLSRTLVHNMTQKEDSVLVLSYTRKVLGQTGDGHFSPVGGYHPARDLVLILDTARFKYPPHWVPLTLIWEAMNAKDKSTGKAFYYQSSK